MQVTNNLITIMMRCMMASHLLRESQEIRLEVRTNALFCKENSLVALVQPPLGKGVWIESGLNKTKSCFMTCQTTRSPRITMTLSRCQTCLWPTLTRLLLIRPPSWSLAAKSKSNSKLKRMWREPDAPAPETTARRHIASASSTARVVIPTTAPVSNVWTTRMPRGSRMCCGDGVSSWRCAGAKTPTKAAHVTAQRTFAQKSTVPATATRWAATSSATVKTARTSTTVVVTTTTMMI